MQQVDAARGSVIVINNGDPLVQCFELHDKPVPRRDTAITDVQFALIDYVSEFTVDRNQVLGWLVALVGAQIWVADAHEFDPPPAELLIQLGELNAEAVALIFLSSDLAVMLSADSDGRCGFSRSNTGTADPTLDWYSPPEIPPDAHRILRPFRSAMGAPDTPDNAA